MTTQKKPKLENLVYDSQDTDHNGEHRIEEIKNSRRIGEYIKIMMDHFMPNYTIEYQIYKKEK